MDLSMAGNAHSNGVLARIGPSILALKDAMNVKLSVIVFAAQVAASVRFLLENLVDQFFRSQVPPQKS